MPVLFLCHFDFGLHEGGRLRTRSERFTLLEHDANEMDQIRNVGSGPIAVYVGRLQAFWRRSFLKHVCHQEYQVGYVGSRLAAVVNITKNTGLGNLGCIAYGYGY